MSVHRGREGGFSLGFVGDFETKIEPVGGNGSLPKLHSAKSTAAQVYKTQNYKAFEEGVKRHLQQARDALNRAELTFGEADGEEDEERGGRQRERQTEVETDRGGQRGEKKRGKEKEKERNVGSEGTKEIERERQVDLIQSKREKQSDKRSQEVASKFQNALSDADVSLQQLDFEAKGSPSGQALSAEVAAYGEELKRLRARALLVFGASPSQVGAGSLPTDLSGVNTRLIGECRATAQQTEGLGLYIVEQLRSQRDIILKTNRLAEATGAEVVPLSLLLLLVQLKYIVLENGKHGAVTAFLCGPRAAAAASSSSSSSRKLGRGAALATAHQRQQGRQHQQRKQQQRKQQRPVFYEKGGFSTSFFCF
ncbi:hypothetical protein Esti_002119 [Eimeria stiedai]